MSTLTSVIPAGFDVAKVREDFPVLKQTIHGKPLVYLDSAATAQKPFAVIDAIRKFYEVDCANIHRGVHELSQRSTASYEETRSKAKRFLNSRFTNELIFAPIGTALTDLGTAIGGISPVLEPIGTIFDDLGGLSTFIGNQIQGLYDSTVTFNQLLFDIPIQLINFGSDLFDLLTGQPTEAAAGLATDFSGLAGGVSADLSGLLGAAPADLSALGTDLLTIF